MPYLHAIAGPEEVRRADFVELATRLLDQLGPALAVHLRAPEISARRLWELARALSRVAASGGGWCVVNGRPDVALAAGAQGVQVGRGAIPLEATLRLVEGRAAVGASVHATDEAVEAARCGANWLLLGTIYPTPSHPGRAAGGPVAIERAAAALGAAELASRPLVAIGGIDPERAHAVRRAGAHGVAARRAVWTAARPLEAARAMVAAMGAGSGSLAGPERIDRSVGEEGEA